MKPTPRFRADFAAMQRWLADDRPAGEIIERYLIERGFGERLRTAGPGERTRLYCEAAAAAPPPDGAPEEAAAAAFAADVRLLGGFLRPHSTFLDIGCGDAVIPFAAARVVALSIGLDVTDRQIDYREAPANFRFLPSDGRTIALPDASVDFVNSNQLVEHLHADDAAMQAREIHRVLKPGGSYLCRTPSRLTGPHDASCYFDDEANGRHLREYDGRTLARLLREAGFGHVRLLLILRHRIVATLPAPLQAVAERLVETWPRKVRKSVPALRLLRPCLGVNALATK